MATKKSNRLMKVIYFDESSALDCIDIEYNGRTTNARSNEATVKASASAGLSATTPKLLSFFKADARVNASADAQQIVKKQVTNTILTDFLKIADNKERFYYFEGYSLSIFKDSTTYYKTLSPIARALKGEMPIASAEQVMNLEISQMGSIVEGIQGYSEFVATKQDGRLIFRFNDLAFRNNYRLLDMPKMSMSFYGVKVGRIKEKELSFNAMYNQESATADLQGLIEQGNNTPEEDHLEVYDIILAGIFSNNEK